MKVLPTIVDTSTVLAGYADIIPDGVICKEINTNRFKIGNGAQRYSALLYIDQRSGEPTQPTDFVTKQYLDNLVSTLNSTVSGNYVTTAQLTTKLNDYALKTSLSSYATTGTVSSLSGTVSSLSGTVSTLQNTVNGLVSSGTGAPKPTTSGIGTFQALAGSGNSSSATLPAGGTWAYAIFLIYINSNYHAESSHAGVGVAAGGTAVSAGKGYSGRGAGLFGFCWRIA